MKALLINGYETWEGVGENRLNKSLIQIAKDILEKKGYEVQVTVVEDGYDAQKEHEKFLWADVVFVQTPIYYFNVPAKFKEYIDKVYMIGYMTGETTKGDGRTREDASKKYGTGGLLTDKKYMISSTWNAPKDAFDSKDGFFEGKSVDDVLVSIHKSYQFLGLKQLPSFEVFDIFKQNDGTNIEKDIENFKQHIQKNF